jgi:superfamily II DNA or RNA helicase
MRKPQHPKSAKFLRKQLFHDLSCFKELESRISSLATNKERGDAFEVFAEAYFASQQKVQAGQIWPFEVTPLPIKQRFALDTERDLGVDGIFQTHLGQFHAYQVKFRTGRPNLTWDKLSTFMGLTDQVPQRVLLTNCDGLPSVLNERSGFYCIRGSDLDRLEPRDFKVIAAWLAGSYFPHKKKDPRPHQVEAMDSILHAFERHDRITTLMACGTGKTLVALWAAERMGCRRLIVFVPALALLRQTLHEWLKETHWEKVSYLCVCSDPTVERETDDVIIKQTDLDFPVSTDSDTVREFLEREYDGVKVVFSTYQSAQVVAEGMDNTASFELGIFDEAHKTAGRKGAKFAFALDDDNLPIKKRFFMTATPRHYNVRKKDKEGDSKLVYSMDVPEVYGPVAYKLWFSEAARRGIICNYKVIISVVTSKMVNDKVLSRGEVIVEGDPVKTSSVANQIALQKAVEKYDMRKIFTFHRTVASAKSFTSPGSEGVAIHLPGFETYHVSGSMHTVKRDKLMNAFREAGMALMSNARCLTEGVDVPAVDMVAFLAPKRSRVDIVQATGRAMRKESGKSTGYVLIPLFLELTTGESLEEAFDRAEFDEVWNVLQAMQEQDDVLADIIQQMKEERGRSGGYDDTRFREKVKFLGPDLSLDYLRESIIAACIEELGSTWDQRYGELITYREIYGHCNVPQSWPENPELGRWVSFQRYLRKKERLSGDRIRRLEKIGFTWDTKEAYWEEMFSALLAFSEVSGHCVVPYDWPKDPNLGTWVRVQRREWKKGRLRHDRFRRLKEVGFVFDPFQTKWEVMFLTLAEFKKKYGHCNVPQNWPDNPKLGNWVITQRQLKKKGQLSLSRIQRLDDTGFIWDTLDSIWELMFLALVEFRNKYGHCDVPKEWPKNQKLSNWVFANRKFFKVGELNKDRIRRLEKIGFIWDTRKAGWEEMFSALLQFKNTYDHCNVPDDWPDNPKLAKWVSHQRRFYRRGEIREERIRCLEEVGFIWNTREADWQEMFLTLQEYKNTYGHCNVPQDLPEDPKLGRWVSTQRQLYNKGRLREDRIWLLEQIGFVWNPHEISWDVMFSALIKFKKKHGHCRVPAKLPEHPRLSVWVGEQRRLLNEGKLREDRIRRLEKIGFHW